MAGFFLYLFSYIIHTPLITIHFQMVMMFRSPWHFVHLVPFLAFFVSSVSGRFLGGYVLLDGCFTRFSFGVPLFVAGAHTCGVPIPPPLISAPGNPPPPWPKEPSPLPAHSTPLGGETLKRNLIPLTNAPGTQKWPFSRRNNTGGRPAPEPKPDFWCPTAQGTPRLVK